MRVCCTGWVVLSDPKPARKSLEYRNESFLRVIAQQHCRGGWCGLVEFEFVYTGAGAQESSNLLLLKSCSLQNALEGYQLLQRFFSKYSRAPLLLLCDALRTAMTEKMEAQSRPARGSSFPGTCAYFEVLLLAILYGRWRRNRIVAQVVTRSDWEWTNTT